MIAVAKILEGRIRTVRYSALPQLPLIIAAMELNSENSENPDYKKKQVSRLSGYQVDRFTGLQVKTPASLLGAPSIPSVPKQTNVKISLETLMSKWPAILAGVKSKNHGLVTLLSNCRPIAVDGQSVTLEVRYKFHKEQLEQSKFRPIVEQIFADVLGADIDFKVKLGDKTKTVLKEFVNDDNIRAVSDTELSSIAEEIFSI